jgi:NAD(P)H dehydrogenase (quinone)
MSGSILVSGAGGHLGRRVVELLLERKPGAQIVATTRKPESLADLAARGVDVRRADFDDEASLPSAFAGVEHALIISTDKLDQPGQRVLQHRNAINAAAKAGVKHLTYTSIINPLNSKIILSKDHAETEAALGKSGLAFTVLRDNMYSDFLFSTVQRAIASGTLVDAKGAGKVGYVTREDCATIAAAVLLEAPPGNQILDVTGPQSIGSVELAALISELSGRKVEHQSIALSALVDGIVQHGLPRPVAEIYASFDAGIAAGELDVASDHVERFTGRKPKSLRDFLLENKAAWAA